MGYKMKSNQCQSIAKSTGIQCTKKPMKGTNYCWVHIPKKGPLIGFIIGAALSLIFTVAWDYFTTSDEEEQIIELRDSLDPFIQMAEKTYPNENRQNALSKLKQDLEGFKKDTYAELNTIREFLAIVEVKFSGDWRGKLSVRDMRTQFENLHHYLSLTKTLKPNDKTIKLYPDQDHSLKFTDSGPKSAIFKTELSVKKTDFPIGFKFSDLAPYDRINIFIFLGWFKSKMNSMDVIIEEVDLTFIINGKKRVVIDKQKTSDFLPRKEKLDDQYISFGVRFKNLF